MHLQQNTLLCNFCIRLGSRNPILDVSDPYLPKPVSWVLFSHEHRQCQFSGASSHSHERLKDYGQGWALNMELVWIFFHELQSGVGGWVGFSPAQVKVALRGVGKQGGKNKRTGDGWQRGGKVSPIHGVKQWRAEPKFDFREERKLCRKTRQRKWVRKQLLVDFCKEFFLFILKKELQMMIFFVLLGLYFQMKIPHENPPETVGLHGRKILTN